MLIQVSQGRVIGSQLCLGCHANFFIFVAKSKIASLWQPRFRMSQFHHPSHTINLAQQTTGFLVKVFSNATYLKIATIQEHYSL